MFHANKEELERVSSFTDLRVPHNLDSAVNEIQPQVMSCSHLLVIMYNCFSQIVEKN